MDVLFSTPYSGALYSWFMQRKADFNAGLYEYPMDCLLYTSDAADE